MRLKGSGEDDLHDMYASPNTILVTKSRRRWEGHVARMGKNECLYKVYGGEI
jgi:hypothetical protein